MVTLFNLLILLPFSSFILLCVFGRFFGSYGAMVLSVTNIVLSLLCAIIIFYNISFTHSLYSELWQWASISGFDISFSLRYDSLTSIMFLVVTFISGCVHIYSCVYMYTDINLTRFMSYLSLFTFFMLLLVSGGNLLVLFFGWEGVGLCSYLLISFWNTRVQAAKAATKAFLINKIGDLFLLTGISVILINFHTVEFSAISNLCQFYCSEILEIIALLLFLGAVGKSAQIGLHTWLPDAMEGPTPVSALIHAATMVTAGVFLIIRCSFLFEFAPRVLFLISIWGGLTALISGLIGATQNDIKKIIAYSTCSQLGYMVLVSGLSAYNIALFHLFNHAFFKALLFLSAGSIIHLLNNEQDIRKMGGIIKLSPFIYINMLIASLALAGTPFLSGYYSKDIIIEVAASKLWASTQILYWFTILSAIITIIYSFKLFDRVFWTDFNGSKFYVVNHIKITNVELLVLSILGVLSIFSGYLFKDLFVGLGSNYFNNVILQLPQNWILVETEFLSSNIKIIPVIFSYLAFEIENKLFECKWFYNEVINGYVAIPTMILSRHYFEQYEKYQLELNGPLFFIDLCNNVYKKIK